MKRTLLLASIVAIASFTTISQPALAADPAPAAKTPSKAAAAKPAASQAKAPQRKASEAKPADAKKEPAASGAATDASPLMGAFQSSDDFLVTVVKSADGNPSKDVLITIIPVTDPKNPRWCQFFGDATITSASQTKVRVTQYQPRHVPHSIPACSVTLEASKDQLRLSGHSPECESLCLGVPEAYVPKQPLVRLKD